MRHGVFVLTIDGRRTGAPHGTLLASLAAVPRRHMLYLRRYCHIICTIGHEVPPRIEVRLQDLHERGSVTAPALRAANTGSRGPRAAPADGPERGGGRRSRVDLLAAFARCVEIKILRRVLNHRVVLHDIDATPARWRGGVVSHRSIQPARPRSRRERDLTSTDLDST